MSTIRKATVADIPRIIELLHQVNMVHHRLRPDLFKPHTTKYSESKNDRLLVDHKTLYIDDLCVDENVRGKQIGRKLFSHVREYARYSGCQSVRLNVWEGNDAALRFYQNMDMHVLKTCMELKLLE